MPKYDEMVVQQDKLSSNNTRPESSVVHTIGEYKGSPAHSDGNDDQVSCGAVDCAAYLLKRSAP